MRWIYLSPHLDDAALSAGGWIHDQTRAGNPVEIWTVMCGCPPAADLSPFAQVLHLSWGIASAEEVVRSRRLEEERAAKILGAQTQCLDFLDCIYRRNERGEWLYSGIFVDPHPDEADLPARIAQTVSARLKPDDELVCQLGVGRHVDHLLVRRAAELLGRPLHYVADIPYLFNAPEHLPPHTAGMKEKIQMVSEAGLRSWVEAVAQYESQLSSLFPSLEQMREQIRQYYSENNGIRFWTIV
ncbi:MAG: hypothetical protein DPW18_03290 [Chloroflexi bacterium]|nr:hypothetical protein [Chloroflexota bacterium]MDL1943099.1 hypothetical protein [Chloroflexi bacterium CFX2]